MPGAITLEIENLPEFTNCWNRAVGEVSTGVHLAVRLGCKEGLEEAFRTRRWVDRTGNARKNSTGEVLSQTATAADGVIHFAFPYASYLAEGTEPHDIYPRVARNEPRAPGQKIRRSDDIGTRRVALRWYDPPGDNGGVPHFARKVHHPGTKPDNFAAHAYLKCERVMIRELELGTARAQNILDI